MWSDTLFWTEKAMKYFVYSDFIEETKNFKFWNMELGCHVGSFLRKSHLYSKRSLWYSVRIPHHGDNFWGCQAWPKLHPTHMASNCLKVISSWKILDKGSNSSFLNVREFSKRICSCRLEILCLTWSSHFWHPL